MKNKNTQKEKLDNYLKIVKGEVWSKSIGKTLPILTSSLALSLPCVQLSGAIQVRDLNITFSVDGEHPIDVDNNNAREFSIRIESGGDKFINMSIFVNGMGVSATSSSSYFGFVKKLSAGAEINNPMWNPKKFASADLTNVRTATGRNWFDDNSTNYIGFRFKIGSNNHFGWLELQVTDYNPGPAKVVIGRVAYEDIPNKPINAGETAPTAPTPSISIATVTASSTENSGAALKYQFTASAAPSTDLTVNFAITGTAALGDFMVTNSSTVSYDNSASNTNKEGTIIIKSGETTADLLVVPTGDAMIEDDETVIVTVANP